MTTTIYLRTQAGRIHKAQMDDQGSIFVQEGDNLDQSHDEEVLLELPESAEDFCERCFPRMDDPPGVAPV